MNGCLIGALFSGLAVLTAPGVGGPRRGPESRPARPDTTVVAMQAILLSDDDGGRPARVSPEQIDE